MPKLARDSIWRVDSAAVVAEDRTLYRLFDPFSGERLDVLSPPEECRLLPEDGPGFTKEALSPYGPWLSAHQALRFASLDDSGFAALHAARISPEPYRFAPLAQLLKLPRPCLLIADDVGLGKTIEAGICMIELMRRGLGKRILLVVPPGLIAQWQEEVFEKFGLRFTAIENAASLERAQTRLSEGIKPWVFLNRIIT